MPHTRRDFSLLFASLATALEAEASHDDALVSKVYDYAELPVKENPQNGAESRAVLNGITHEGFPIEAHITKLPPGQMPHAPHRHAWEEILFLQTGTLQMTINGHTSLAVPGSVIYIASNEEHGSKNVGDIPAQYFVLAIGHHPAV